jgi:hypothetical protein
LASIYRARIFTPVTDPFANEIEGSYRYFEDGHLAVDDMGRITSVGDWSDHPGGEVIELGPAALSVPHQRETMRT